MIYDEKHSITSSKFSYFIVKILLMNLSECYHDNGNILYFIRTFTHKSEVVVNDIISKCPFRLHIVIAVDTADTKYDNNATSHKG